MGAALAISQCALAAQAQVAGSVSLASDYQYRGLSLSDGRPALSLDASYDSPTGIYLGGSALAEDVAHSGARMLGYVEYVGYARRLDANSSWDVGWTNQNIAKYYDQPYKLDYAQIYAGLKHDRFAYYIYYSPNYFGEGYRTVYVDVSGGFRPARRIRAFGHIGALTALGGSLGTNSPRVQVDLGAGVAAEFMRGELQLAWATAVGNLDYVAGHPQRRAGPMVSALFSF